MLDPALVSAATALQDNNLANAEALLRARLRDDPTQVPAIRMLAEVAGRLGRYADAEALLRRALDLAPGFHAARANYATVLHRQSKFEAAHAQADQLLEADPDDPNHLAIKAAVLVRTGGYDEAIACYEAILRQHPDQPKLWVSYGHVLKTVGRQAESVVAYRKAVGLKRSLGDAWWSLANLKTVGFGAADIAEMTAALDDGEATAEDRYHLHFALGKALEDAGSYAPSFHHYARGNSLRRAELPYDPEEITRHVERSRRLLTREVFETRRGAGLAAPDPIFVVGLPRAGSTLIEQILASHSQVEGTMELPDITSIASDLSGREAGDGQGYIPRLLDLAPAELEALGRRYLDGTRIQRKTGRPLFIDKMPNNFAHIGLIQLILPRATIIDARRHPMATCFSAFKQHFSRGQGFTYDLVEVGRYYNDYIDLMAHYDEVLPGRVYRVIHEELVADPEAQIRGLLDHCRLTFEPACLSFHETKRAVRTASSEQVRQPITTAGLEQWRNFEAWLGPLHATVDDAVRTYPA